MEIILFLLKLTFELSHAACMGVEVLQLVVTARGIELLQLAKLSAWVDLLQLFAHCCLICHVNTCMDLI